MTQRDARNDLINEICMWLTKYELDLQETKMTLCMIANKYEILERSTEIAEVKQNKNDSLVRKFLLAKAVGGKTKRTLEYYGREIPRALERMGKNVDDISADDIRRLMAIRLKRDKVSERTVENERLVLSSFLSWVSEEGIITENPMRRVEKIKRQTQKKEAFTEMEIERMRLACRDAREHALVEILLSTGARISELANIRIDDVEGERVLVHGKGKKDRYVYLNAKAILALQVYLGERSDTNPYLFAGGMGMTASNKLQKLGHNWWKCPECVDIFRAQDISSLGAVIRRIGKRAGAHAYPHKFRRTFATTALKRGMPIIQVSKMLGHESLDTTQIYLDLSEDDLRNAHRKYVA